MPLRLLDFLNKPRYQILYYIFVYGKISCDNSKTHIARSFGYKSVGHFWGDFDDLLNNKLIIIKKNNYVLGSEGTKEILFFSALNVGLYFSAAFSILFLWYYYMTLKQVIIPNIVYLMTALVLIFLSYIFYNTKKALKPTLPETINDLK